MIHSSYQSPQIRENSIELAIDSFQLWYNSLKLQSISLQLLQFTQNTIWLNPVMISLRSIGSTPVVRQCTPFILQLTIITKLVTPIPAQFPFHNAFHSHYGTIQFTPNGIRFDTSQSNHDTIHSHYYLSHSHDYIIRYYHNNSHSKYNTIHSNYHTILSIDNMSHCDCDSLQMQGYSSIWNWFYGEKKGEKKPSTT